MRLSTIRHMYTRPGPWASVYLDTSGADPHARRLIDLRWRGLRDQLDHADEATLDAAGKALLDGVPPVGTAGRAVFAARGEVGFAATLPEPPPRDTAAWSPQPRAAALLRLLGEEVRWLRADVDRTGGAVTSHDGGTIQVRGANMYPISKVSAGGWSMPRYQRAAEENWDRNSGDVAVVVADAAEEARADVVVLSGDVRARRLVLGRLPVALRPLVIEVDYEAPAEPDPSGALDEATREAVTVVARDRQERALDRFRAGVGDGHSVRGIGPVAAAARDQRIEVLILGAGDNDREAWVDPANPALVATRKRALGVPEPALEPADDALVGAAALAAADAIVADDDALVDGVGAILRYPASG